MSNTSSAAGSVWIRGPQLRQRWGGMSNSTFYERLRAGEIPAPEYPFAATIPYWRLDQIEQFEAKASQQKAAA